MNKLKREAFTPLHSKGHCYLLRSNNLFLHCLTLFEINPSVCKGKYFTRGFVGEFMIMIGSFKSTLIDNRVFTVLAGLGIIFSAVYMLWMYQRVMFGPAHQDGLYGGHQLFDLSKREIAALVPIVLFIVWIGIYPKTFLGKSSQVVKHTVEQMESVKHGSQMRFTDSVRSQSEK